MKNRTNLFASLSFSLLALPTFAQTHDANRRFEAEQFLNTHTARSIADAKMSNKLGVSTIGNDTETSCITFTFNTDKPGLYNIESFAITDDIGTKLMEKAKTKFESLFLEIQINEQPKTKRVVAVPWNIPKQELGKFNLESKNTIKIWLPKGVILDYIDIHPYQSPKVPEVAHAYKPPYTPKGHPRLWVNQQTLADVQKNVELAENKARWEQVKDLALKKVDTKPFLAETSFDENLEKIIEAKAFYYLITNDKEIGQETIALTKNYIDFVSFGNLLDITREIGRTIHITAEVYDWCYALLSDADKADIRKNLMRLAMDMEIGWPPFLQPIVNGHGAEAQINRDLLSMAIAIYDEDPIPYQYCAYAVLEELVPMRKFEYQSPRHNQGINYGAYRINWDFHAAWLFKRMLNQEVFDENIKQTADYWLYSRLPDGQMLRDGDHSLSGKPGQYNYWQINPTSFFMNYSYSQNPYLKHSFEKMNSSSVNPVLFLLLNDPNFKSKAIPTDYPLNKDFGNILGGMINRTGWEDNIKSNNVVAEIKGGGYYFSNHQHNDAGAIQIYHRGFQVADLGQYKFYGTPYDLNFTKRSVAHSMMLAIDPKEKIGNIPSNDGGTRMYRKIPNSPAELIQNIGHHHGEVLSASIAKSNIQSKFNYFAADLTSAYSEKLKNYVRQYIFMHTGNEEIPAIIVLKDVMETASPEFKKYWQVNTINKPSVNNEFIKLTNSRDSLTSNTYIKFVYPKLDELDTKVLTAEEAHNVFGFQVTPPPLGQIESTGSRIMVSPKTATSKNEFLTVFQMVDGNNKPMPMQSESINGIDYIFINAVQLIFANQLEKLAIKVQTKNPQEIFITGLQAGNWKLVNHKGKVIDQLVVQPRENTTTVVLKKGNYTLQYKN